MFCKRRNDIKRAPWKMAWILLVDFNFKRSHLRCFVKKGVLENFAKFTGKHLCQSLFLIKLQSSGLQRYLKRDSGTGVFLWILWKFLRTPFFRIPPSDCFNNLSLHTWIQYVRHTTCKNSRSTAKEASILLLSWSNLSIICSKWQLSWILSGIYLYLSLL